MECLDQNNTTPAHVARPLPKLNLLGHPDGPSQQSQSGLKFVVVMACPPNLYISTTVIIVQDHNFPL